MKNKRILITGVAGSIGSELCRQLCTGNKVYGVDTNETGLADLLGELSFDGRVGDIRDAETVREIYSDFKPQIVIHAAAYKHVTPMELTPEEAIKTNVLGTLNMLRYAKIYPVDKFVFISTDKAVQSNSIMGATKRLGEIMVKNQGKGFVVVRFGNVLGSRGSVIPIWERQINQGKNITLTDPKMERFFMTIPQACNLVLGAAELGRGGEIIVLNMGTPVKLMDVAQQVIAHARDRNPFLKPAIDIVGRRPGEQMQEKLMFDEEERVAQKVGNYYVIK